MSINNDENNNTDFKFFFAIGGRAESVQEQAGEMLHCGEPREAERGRPFSEEIPKQRACSFRTGKINISVSSPADS
jgi:hypothetical protein